MNFARPHRGGKRYNVAFILQAINRKENKYGLERK